ncbi:hypothetical protein KC721_02030 [Candidatus Woesebacteria bacterium]|nr:hypothetical protein [Candidatus Woesebacteria bacterium]
MRWNNRLLLLLFGSLLFLLPLKVIGQSGGVAPGETLSTNPKSREQTVTAIVPDIIPPSTPILISPEDESVLTTSTPTFEWQASTDNVGVDHYQLWIDDSLLFDNIPTTAVSNGNYTLLYDSSSNHYFLTPTSPTGDGDHTWQVHAYDAADNYSESVIWDFTIDTTAPYFEITDIGPESVAINTGDANSVPTEPIHLADNEPLLVGKGEEGAEVQLTITIPGDPTQNHTFTVGSGSNWSFQIGILPRGEIITLDFVISDASGNISIISDLQIIIDPIVIIIPPQPSPTPFSTPTPTPGVTPSPEATPSATPSPVPSPSPAPSPIIIIPISPPREIVHEIIQETIELLPEEVVTSIPAQIVAQVAQIINRLSPFGALLITAAPPLISLLSLLLQFGGNLSWQLLLRILQAIGLLPAQEPQGIVFNSETNEPVPFAILTIEGTDPEANIFETVVTDENGIYQGIQLPKGEYLITVKHEEFVFPTAKNRPKYLSITDFYKGETFTVSNDKTHQLFLIPVDPISKEAREKTLQNRYRIVAAQLRMKNVFVPMFVISLIITILSPSWLNYIVICIYFLVFMKKYLITNRRANLKGEIRTTDGLPIEYAVIRISDPATTELVALVSSDKKGRYAAYCDPKTYYITITKANYVWYRQSGNMGFEEVTLGRNTVQFDATLTSLDELNTELFS